MTGETVYMQSETRYAMSGDVSIAYRVIGDGAIDIVFVHGFVSHLEVQAENPGDRAFFERLAELGLVRSGSTGEGPGCPTDHARFRRLRRAWTTSGP